MSSYSIPPIRNLLPTTRCSKSGAETRDYLRSRAEDGTDYVKRRANDLRDTAAEAIDRSKETIRRQKENLSAAVDAGKQAYREAVKTPIPD